MAQSGDKPRWPEAVSELDKVITEYQTTKRVDKTIAANAYFNKGLAQIATGQPLQAIEAFSSSLTLAKNVAPGDMEFVQSILWLSPLQMGNAYSSLAQKDAAHWQSAAKAYNAVAQLFESAQYPIDGKIAAQAYDGLATAYEAMGDAARARANYDKLLEIAYIDTLAPELSDRARKRLKALQ